jgi:hypothetical protein
MKGGKLLREIGSVDVSEINRRATREIEKTRYKTIANAQLKDLII